MSAITLSHVTKRFGETEVCRDLNLDIAAGEFVTLLGSSGCGKTTTLNMIAGLEEVTSGDILIEGRRVNDLAPADRNAAMVFQNYALYPHMTVAENIGFALRLRGVPREEIDKRVAPVAAALELGHVLDRRPAQLSGGQQQRVAIGRAIIREPKVFLFDEPFSNLDAALRLKMRGEVKELHSRLKVTSVFVTHDQEEAMSISDRIAVMRQGVIEQVGTPEEIYSQPATTYVATFIGSPQVEILKARREGDRLTVGTLAVPLDHRSGRALATHSGEVDVAIRPEHIRIGSEGTPARVRVTQPIGPATLVTVDWDGGSMPVRMPGLVKLASHESVSVDFDPDAVMLFDRTSGRRLQ
ncbi:MAG: sn-glycerol-3-phosphate ABC transporter ATP-binding protein UgpC [Hyphomicrobiaceae bacterium]